MAGDSVMSGADELAPDIVAVGAAADFEEFAASGWPGLVRLAYGLTGDRWLAEDLAQTALARAYASWWRVRRAADPDAYLYRILINSSNSRFRRRRVAEQPGELPEMAVPDHAATVDDRAELLDALRELPPRQRAVVLLRYWADLTDTQTAAALGCSPATVRSQASRALEKLRITLTSGGDTRG
jgi:RNA polymerase sigma-70 factor (sigma-E family)